MKTFVRTPIFPELFIAPRGLITILLLFSIPEHLMTDHFQEDIIFMVIIGTNLIMMFALMVRKKKDPDGANSLNGGLGTTEELNRSIAEETSI
jgi:NhaP-type Na+/H+ or K+/H+ antiporter